LAKAIILILIRYIIIIINTVLIPDLTGDPDSNYIVYGGIIMLIFYFVVAFDAYKNFNNE